MADKECTILQYQEGQDPAMLPLNIPGKHFEGGRIKVATLKAQIATDLGVPVEHQMICASQDSEEGLPDDALMEGDVFNMRVFGVSYSGSGGGNADQINEALGDMDAMLAMAQSRAKS
mmetsp:Transcript_29663/g.47778  ORF Transcript_29663/g.47778 Transcript_29663/m.47778 type:complete len:118 (-) Transcript_29663:141-494(-)|eukprot:CAMPEP_0169069630 /NCGR_PEP_ID=MMETSP1015-20121227/4675_1 /TAXON_ID=342587 /ORGANISM="Karlodinium micrum, Strain CCMP2283" /LENGTH=117 /DNA_ID=CAMNT_0009128555 /DNA_START=78 /DNA_END=431 /DNA_ORIENTATION=-